MSSLPSGTVTFLFTDIEGSTKLAQEYPDTWESLCDQHHSILKRAIESNHGYWFQIIGDAFCVAFHTVVDALNAAVEAQRGLQSEEWGESIIKVRMGLHTGSAELHGNDYRGYLTMAKVQRIMSVAYGGQVLLSNASAELLDNGLPAGITLRDLKEHRLKGLPDPERLWQMVAPDLQQDFPPLSSLSEILNNLPAQLIPLIGREKEIDDVAGLLRDPEILLITLHGFGGTGKTRLAVEVGRVATSLFPDGVWFVALASLNSPEHIVTATAAALGFSFQSHEDQEGQLIHFLQGKKLLLILDNLEHLLPEGSTQIEAILENATDIQFLVTSRQPINAPWEMVYPLQGLEYEASPSQSNGKVPAAAQLFLQQLSRVAGPAAQNDLVCASQICQLVRGLPLALLLAASWGRVLECSEIVQEIQRGIGILQTQHKTFPERHSSMQAVFDYSWQLLSDREQAVLRKLSIFRGGFDRAAAAAVAGVDRTLLAAFIDQSFVERVTKDRYQIHELLRQYLHDRLAEAGEEVSTRDQHLAHYVQLAEHAEPELIGERLDIWIKWFTSEIDNIRAALEWSLAKQEAVNLEKGLWLMVSTGRLWQLHAFLREGLAFLARILALLPDELRKRPYANCLNLMRELSFRIRDYTEARRLANEVLRIALDLNDSQLVGDAYYGLGSEAFVRNDFTASHSFVQQALESFQKIDDPLRTALALNLLGDTEFRLGNFTAAYHYHSRALDMARKLKDEISIATILHSLGALASVDPHLGLQRGYAWIEEGLEYARKVNDITMVLTFLMDLGENFRQEGRYEEAAAVLEETVQTKNEAVPKEEYIVIWLNLGFVYLRVGKHDRSKQIFFDNLVEIQKFNRTVYNELSYCLLGLAGVVVVEGKSQLAARILGALEANKKSLIFWPTDRSEYERISAAVKAQLTEKQFNQFYKEGQALSLADAAQLVQAQGFKDKGREVERLNQLTKREIEILRLVAQGLSDAQVAERLVLSPRTVNAHLTSIYNKLGVNSRAAATRYAIEHALA